MKNVKFLLLLAFASSLAWTSCKKGDTGAAGATGHGEELWKSVASFRTVEGMRRGLSAQEACEETIRHLVRRQPRGMVMQSVVLALRADGDFGAAVNQGTFHLWSCVDGKIDVKAFEGICS